MTRALVAFVLVVLCVMGVAAAADEPFEATQIATLGEDVEAFNAEYSGAFVPTLNSMYDNKYPRYLQLGAICAMDDTTYVIVSMRSSYNHHDKTLEYMANIFTRSGSSMRYTDSVALNENNADIYGIAVSRVSHGSIIAAIDRTSVRVFLSSIYGAVTLAKTISMPGQPKGFALHGTTMFVSFNGVYVYEMGEDARVWNKVQEIETDTSTSYAPLSISSDGSTLILQLKVSSQNDKTQKTILFEKDVNGTWTQVRVFESSNYNLKTAASCSTLVLGGAMSSSGRTEKAYVSEKGADGTWSDPQMLPVPAGATYAFGQNVAVLGATVFVSDTVANFVHAYEKNADGEWTEVQKISGKGVKRHDDRFGTGLAAFGSYLTVSYTANPVDRSSSGGYIAPEFFTTNRDSENEACAASAASVNGTTTTFEGTAIMQKITEYSAEHDKVFARNQALTTEAIEVRTELANLREKREALINMTVDDPPLPVIDMSALSVDNVTVGENATSGLGDAAASTSTDAVDLVAEFQKAHDKVIADTTELQKEIDYLRVKRGEIVDLMVGHTPVPVVDCGSDASAAAARGAALGETPATNSTLIMEYVADYQTKHDEVIEKTKVVKEEIAHVNAIRDKIIKLNPAITIDVTGHEATTASALGAALRFSSSAALRVGAPALALAAVAAVAGAALSKSRLDRRRRVGADEETLLVEGTKYGAVHA